MPRLPEELIQQIKQDCDLVQLIQSQGYQLKKNGKDYLLSCPWHEDTEASLVVSPDTNLWHCMGACQMGGSVIDWVMKTQGVSFRLACEILQKEQGLIHNTDVVKYNTSKKLPSPLAANADNQKLLHQVMVYYHYVLKHSPEALEYLQKRGLNSPELINTFKLGYANRTLGYRLPDKNRKAGSDIRCQLQEIGILRKTGHEHFNGSIVVPVMDENNHIQEVYGRKILGNRLRKGTAQHLYLPGSHEGVWNSQALAVYDEIILCEALIDAMTFWVHGFKNVTASYGTSGFTASHLVAFKENAIKRVLIAYDRDEAGNTAADLLAQKLNQQGIDCYRLLFPKKMDVNEYALKMSPADKSLALVIRKAQWMGKGKPPETQLLSEGSQQFQNEKKAAKEKNSPQQTTQSKPSTLLAAKSSQKPNQTETPVISPIPQTAQTIEAEIKDNEIHINLGERHYRIRGLGEQTSTLKINLMLRLGEGFHNDKLDLYAAKQRTVFMNQASEELAIKTDIIKKDLGKLLLKLEEIQQDQQTQANEKDKPVPLSEQEQKAALALLQDKNLINIICQDFTKMGMVGEQSNTLVGYLGCVSRKLDKPLAIMIQSSSAAGKSALMESILDFMPENERTQYSAMTGQSLFYLSENSLKHKILAISEEEGASNASYALKLLQSEGKVTIASTGKDNDSGQLVTQEYTVKGPTMLFMTTTAIDIDEELLNRCLVLSVNETREQTQAIHKIQRSRRTLAGIENQLLKNDIAQLHRNAQSLLKPIQVINPYADQLTFLSDKTRTRRDHEKYLTLIDCIALLHQYQREIKTIVHNNEVLEYIEVTQDDLKLANQLAHEVLGRTLDELPPQTRKLLSLIQQMVRDACLSQQIERSDYRFSRRQIREYTDMGNTQLKVHCHRLEELEYLLIHRGGRGQSFEYELLYDNYENNTHQHLMGLIDVQNLDYDAKKSGVNNNQSGQRSDRSGGKSASSRWGVGLG
jgi:DNA primase